MITFNGSSKDLVKATAIVVVVAMVPVLVWLFRDLILLAVGALVLAALLHLVAAPLRLLHAPRAAALVVAGLLLLVVVAGTAWIFGNQVAYELSDVFGRAKSSVDSIRHELDSGLLGQISDTMGLDNLSLTSYVGSMAKLLVNAIEAAIIILVTGTYIAAEPEIYRKGLVWLFPRADANMVEDMLGEFATGLRLWLIGQLIQMLLVGILSFVAVWLLGVHSPIGLGLIAAVCEFVPYVGPVIAAVPAVLVAFSQSTTLVVWTIVAFVIIHQIEGHLFVPLVQRRLVVIPPAAMLLGIVAVELFFGLAGLLFAGPLVVLVYFAVKKLYVQRNLGRDVRLPGEAS